MKLIILLMTLVLAVGSVGEVSHATEPAWEQELASVDISENLLQEGGFLKESEVLDGYGEETLPCYLAVDRDAYQSVEDLLKSAYDSFATECNLSQFQLTPAELKTIVAEVLNTNPRYFYVYGGYSYSSSRGYVTRILPRYDYEEAQVAPMLQAYDAAVRQAVRGASASWSDLEKALYINDYLARNCEYDNTYSKYSAYDVFVGKAAVCQGYALAYLELANQLGLSAEIVTSISLNHAWNMVEVNGKYYQEDATWNDPIKDRLGRAKHIYFMKSTEYYRTQADYYVQDDWVVSGGLTWADASSMDYDEYFWDSIDVGFEYVDGYWYGFDGVDRIVKYDCDGSTLQEVEEVLKIDDVWRVTGSNGYYSSKYLGLAQFDGRLYYSNPDTIYCYDSDTKTMQKIYSLSEAEKTMGSIYAMHITPAGEVYYYLTPSLSNTGTVYLATVLTKEESGEDGDLDEGDIPEPEVYTITYELNGGENHVDNPISYTENDSIVFEMPSRANYVFDGWYRDAEYTNPITGISAGTTGNLVLYAKWVEKVYDISFDGNGSTDGQMANMTGCLFDEDYTLVANAYERTGYVFAGWNTRADGTGTTYADGATVRNLTTVNGETAILYAQWEAEEYTLTYQLNGGINNSANPVNYTVNDTYVFANPTRENYVFGGWYRDEEFTNPITGISVGTTGNLILYAKWVAKIYDVRFDGNGSTNGRMSDMAGCLFDKDYTLAVNAYERTGYVFAGWNTRADGTGEFYNDGETVSNMATNYGEIVTLYAQWEIEQYTVVYELNGGINNSMNPHNYTVEDVLVFATPSRENYVFGGWYRDEEFTSPITKISAGTTGNLVLYAKWVTNAYGIRFDGNGSTGGQMPDMAGCLFDNDYELEDNAYERTGYVFTGWNTRADGTGISYEDGVTFRNLTTVNGEIVMLYAQWEIEQYTVFYELNGGTNNSANPSVYTVKDALAFANPTKENYVFGGWYRDAEYTSPITEITVGTTGNLVLYSKWITNTYSIRFDGNGSMGGQMSDMADCLFDKDYALEDNAYERIGYVFAGWSTHADGTGEFYKDGETVSNMATNYGEIVTLYAQWEIQQYTVIYELNGGKNNSANPANYTVNDTYVFANPTKENCVFGGWYRDAEYTNPITEITVGSTGNLVLYAKWITNTYSIRFDGNGSTGGQMLDMADCLFDKDYTLEDNAYERIGYVFAGWSTHADGTGEFYKDGETVSNMATNYGEIVTLYAQWEIQQYTVIYELNGGKNNSANPANYTVNDTYVFANPTKENYVFGGWYTDAEYANSITEITVGSTGNLVLYAKWAPIKYTVKFHGNGATGGKMNSLINREYGLSYSLTKNAYKRTGYAFAGWNTKKNGTGTGYKNQASVENLTKINGKTITLYAQWTPNQYTIKFHGNGATSGKMNPLNDRKYGTSYKLTANAYKRTGYTFAGWNTKKSGKGTNYKNKAKVKSLTSNNGKTVTLYAQWTPNQYTIKFHGNGATSGKMNNLSKRKYGTTYKLTANAFKKKGYTFIGWNTQKNGKGKTYKNRASIKNLTSSNNKTITLYAQWKKQK